MSTSICTHCGLPITGSMIGVSDKGEAGIRYAHPACHWKHKYLQEKELHILTKNDIVEYMKTINNQLDDIIDNQRKSIEFRSELDKQISLTREVINNMGE